MWISRRDCEFRIEVNLCMYLSSRIVQRNISYYGLCIDFVYRVEIVIRIKKNRYTQHVRYYISCSRFFAMADENTSPFIDLCIEDDDNSFNYAPSEVVKSRRIIQSNSNGMWIRLASSSTTSSEPSNISCTAATTASTLPVEADPVRTSSTPLTAPNPSRPPYPVVTQPIQNPAYVPPCQSFFLPIIPSHQHRNRLNEADPTRTSSAPLTDETVNTSPMVPIRVDNSSDKSAPSTSRVQVDKAEHVSTVEPSLKRNRKPRKVSVDKSAPPPSVGQVDESEHVSTVEPSPKRIRKPRKVSVDKSAPSTSAGQVDESEHVSTVEPSLKRIRKPRNVIRKTSLPVRRSTEFKIPLVTRGVKRVSNVGSQNDAVIAKRKTTTPAQLLVQDSRTPSISVPTAVNVDLDTRTITGSSESDRNTTTPNLLPDTSNSENLVISTSSANSRETNFCGIDNWSSTITSKIEELKRLQEQMTSWSDNVRLICTTVESSFSFLRQIRNEIRRLDEIRTSVQEAIGITNGLIETSPTFCKAEYRKTNQLLKSVRTAVEREEKNIHGELEFLLDRYKNRNNISDNERINDEDDSMNEGGYSEVSE